MRSAAEGKVTLTREGATGTVGFVRADDLLPSVDGGSRKGSVDKATAYLDRYASAFGAPRTPARAERRRPPTSTAGPSTTSSATAACAVFGSRLRAHLDRQGDLTAVNGYVAPDLDLSTTPRLSRDAGRRARGRDRQGRPARGRAVPAASTARHERAGRLPPRLDQGRDRRRRPGLRVVEVTNERNVRETRHHRRRQRQAGQPLVDDPHASTASSTRRRSTTAARPTTTPTTP